jgi:hypothetical protein
MGAKEVLLSDYSQHLPYLRLTAEQVIKDFGFFGHEIAFTGNEKTAFEELFSQVLPLVKQLVDKDFAAFCNLLYRIDLAESTVRKMMRESEDFYADITQSILKRALQKVVLRAHFNRPTEGEPLAPALE